MLKFFNRYIFALLFLYGLSCSAVAATYLAPTPGNDIIGHIFTIKVQAKDSLSTLRQRYEVSYHELLEANPQINFYKLKVGQSIIIPSQFILPSYRHGIVINTPELRLYYFSPDGRFVFTYPVGLGRMNWRTPTTITKIVRKQYKPIWYVPDSIREYMYETHGKLLPDFIEPGPENPLGNYALYLEKEGYLIHGTNDQESVGMFVSSGCMRLWADPIEKLFQEVDIGTPVFIIHHAIKAGWFDNTLYLEAHAPIKHDEQINDLNHKSLDIAISEATANRQATIYLQKVNSVMRNRTGIPTPIGEQI